MLRWHQVNVSLEDANLTFGWKQKYKKEEGKCFSYHVPPDIHKLKVITIRINLIEAIDIYLHHPGQFLTWDIYSLTSRIGEQTLVDVQHEVRITQLI